MSELFAAITTSVDGYFVGPDDGPGRGLGKGGERLHYWVFGGPWSYDSPPDGEPGGDDGEWLAEAMATVGAVVAGRWTYEAADHWGGANPWGIPLFIVTHRPDEEPDPSAGFVFVDGLEAAIERARSAAGDQDVYLMGGGNVIRQALDAGLVDRLTIIIAPVILGGGKRLFEGYREGVELEHLGVRQSAFATFIDYRVIGGSSN